MNINLSTYMSLVNYMGWPSTITRTHAGTRVHSVFPIRDHINESVCLHAFNAEVPVALRTPPSINSFRLIEPCDAREAGFSTIDFIACPSPRMILRMLLNDAAWVGRSPLIL